MTRQAPLILLGLGSVRERFILKTISFHVDAGIRCRVSPLSERNRFTPADCATATQTQTRTHPCPVVTLRKTWKTVGIMGVIRERARERERAGELNTI